MAKCKALTGSALKELNFGSGCRASFCQSLSLLEVYLFMRVVVVVVVVDVVVVAAAADVVDSM